MSLLEINHMKKSFGEVEVLKDISMKVEEGEVFGIIGPSGSGKSTLLRCATGLETPDSGEIHYNGTFGLVFQNFNLFPHFSVLKKYCGCATSCAEKKQRRSIQRGTGLLKKMDFLIRKTHIRSSCREDSSSVYLSQEHLQ